MTKTSRFALRNTANRSNKRFKKYFCESSFSSFNNPCARIDPFAFQFSCAVTRSDSHARVIPYSFDLARVLNGVDIKLRVLGTNIRGGISRKPHGSAHARAALSKRFEIQEVALVQRSKIIQIAHARFDASARRADTPAPQGPHTTLPQTGPTQTKREPKHPAPFVSQA